MFSKCMLCYSVDEVYLYINDRILQYVLLCSVVKMCIDLSYLKTNLKDKLVNKTKMTKTHLKVLGEKIALLF